jgi:type IV pilus assembly protein PilY1
VLVSGGREGGSSIFALDVTDPFGPELLWQADLPDGKVFPSQVEFASVAGNSLALVGSGLDEDTGRASLYAYDLTTGHLLGGIGLSASPGIRNKATTPRAVDLDLDGETDLIYCADLLGNVWRFQTGGAASPGGWNRSCLFTGPEPISASTMPAYGENGHIYVYFGTGVYLDIDDAQNTDQQRFYCVYDRHDGHTHTRSDLVNQTGGGNDIGDNDGWYVDLWHEAGERVTERAAIVAQTVFFTAYAPNQDVCGYGGHSWLYRMAYNDGTMPKDEDGGDAYASRDEDLGDGVSSRPVVDIINENVIVQSSDASIEVSPINANFFFLEVRAWQENYDFVSNVTPTPPTQQ